MNLPFPQIIGESNEILATLKKEIQSLGIPKFNSLSLRNSSFTQAVDITVSHRITSKFAILRKKDRTTRDMAFQSYYAYDRGLTSKVPLLLWDRSEPKMAFDVRRARQNCHKITKNFLRYYDEARVELTGGETFISSGGAVSVLAKLSELKHWTVTDDVIDDALRMIYANRGLKAAARDHLRRLGIRKLKPRKNETAEACFCRYVHPLLTIVGGARGATVPKNTETDRFINVEPMFNMLQQRCIAYALRRCLQENGHDLGSVTIPHLEDMHKYLPKFKSHVLLSDAQALHKKLIRDLNNVTIDFSNASDSTLVWAVRLLFDDIVYGRLMKTRSRYVRINHQWYKPNKLSSMGNGFTFEVMTILLLSCARVFDKNSRVYGDDVIIHKTGARGFIDVVNRLGYCVNPKKTFLIGPYRESCGSFQWYGHDITSFDFTMCESFSDVIVSTNKLDIIIRNLPKRSKIRGPLERARGDLHKLIPLRCKCDVSFESNLGAYVLGSARKVREDAACRMVWARTVLSCLTFLIDNHIHPDDIRVVNIPLYVPKRMNVNPTTEFLFGLANLYAMRTSVNTVKGKGKWVNVDVIVLKNGSLVRVSKVRDRSIDYYTPSRAHLETIGESGRTFRTSILNAQAIVSRDT